MLNPTLGQADFYKLRKSDQNGFKKVRVVTVPAKTLLFKMTKGAAAAGQYGVTPWWSAVKPFLEDKEGALGRFQQAKSNGIDMTAMVRFMSCVCLDWNDLDNYVQVELVEEARVFWGTFQPDAKIQPGDLESRLGQSERGGIRRKGHAEGEADAAQGEAGRLRGP